MSEKTAIHSWTMLENSPRLKRKRQTPRKKLNKKLMISERQILEVLSGSTPLLPNRAAELLGVTDTAEREKLYDKIRYLYRKGYFRRIAYDKRQFTYEITLAGRNLLSQYNADDEPHPQPKEPTVADKESNDTPLDESLASLEKSLVTLKEQTLVSIDDLPKKLKTLDRLAAILDTEISSVLMDIYTDLTTVAAHHE